MRRKHHSATAVRPSARRSSDRQPNAYTWRAAKFASPLQLPLLVRLGRRSPKPPPDQLRSEQNQASKEAQPEDPGTYAQAEPATDPHACKCRQHR